MPDNRETTINLVEGEEFAHVWTNVRSMKGRLTRLGLTPYDTQADGYWFKCPQEWFWPRRKRKVAPGQAAHLRRTKSPSSGAHGANGGLS